MEKGIISRWNKKKKYGKIQPDDGGRELNFRIAQVQGVEKSDATRIKKQMAVSFSLEGGKIASVRLEEELAQAKSATKGKKGGQTANLANPASAESPHRFLNPYNFVRQLPHPGEGHLLGRCPPPPHDRYVGLTGRIICQLTAVTPLFVSDSDGIFEEQVNNKTHLHYRFWRDPNDQIAIPSTSLRGAVRSIFEAATNSCFPVFDGSRFDLREGRLPNGLRPVRVVEISESGAKLELLDCSRDLPSKVHKKTRGNGRPIPLMKAASVTAYDPYVLDARNKTPFDPSSTLIPKNIKNGERVAALIDLNPVSKGVYQYFKVIKIVPLDEQDDLEERKGNQKVFGYLHLTGANIEKKHYERLFFRWDDETLSAPTWEAIKKEWKIEVGSETVQEFKQHMAQYWERNKRQVERLGNKPWPITADNLPHPSTFIEPKRTLQEGDLMYYIPSSQLGIPVLRPVLISRLPYKYDRAALLPEAFHVCNEYEQLCPACRTFGWVWEAENPEEAELADHSKRTAYAGRVRFSLAKKKENHDAAPRKRGVGFDATLAILSTPKPTTTRFYLAPSNGKPEDERPDEEVGYNNDKQRLRGRKVYRHHGHQLSRQEYEGLKKSDQNRTVHDVQKKGSQFEFTVHFENLAPVELGALLWSLEMEGWHHRLGYGKPLGFGSVRLQIQGLQILSTSTRYQELDDSGWINCITRKKEWINEFKRAMEARFGQPFDKLPNVRDLRALLSQPPALPIHYPRPTRTPHRDGKNYEWFVGNKQDGKHKGPKLVLPLAEDDRQGLPLIDRRGKVVR